MTSKKFNCKMFDILNPEYSIFSMLQLPSMRWQEKLSFINVLHSQLFKVRTWNEFHLSLSALLLYSTYHEEENEQMQRMAFVVYVLKRMENVIRNSNRYIGIAVCVTTSHWRWHVLWGFIPTKQTKQKLWETWML